MKLYPVIFGFPMLLHLWHTDPPQQRTRAVVSFCAATAASVCALTLAFFSLYGWPFLSETYLYHFTRVDWRHNFSVWFYPFYLALDAWPGAWFSLATLQRSATLLQGAATLGIGLRFWHDLPTCIALQALVFVALNKVITAQYFVWFIALLPLALSHGQLPLASATFWVMAEVRTA